MNDKLIEILNKLSKNIPEKLLEHIFIDKNKKVEVVLKVVGEEYFFIFLYEEGVEGLQQEELSFDEVLKFI